MDKNKMKEVFWNWVDSEGGDYKVARVMGKQNGTFLTRARDRDSMPKLDTLEQMADLFESFPAEELLPRYKRKAQVENESHDINPGAASDGYNPAEGWKLLIKEQENRIKEQAQTIEELKRLLGEEKTEKRDILAALLGKSKAGSTSLSVVYNREVTPVKQGA